MQSDLSSVDLDNIDYDDVLQLHRCWRRSEFELKGVREELAALKDNYRRMQQKHAQFLNELESLESVRDFTINLQAELSQIRQEYALLIEENNQLLELESRRRQYFDSIDGNEMTSKRAVRDAQAEVELTRERYHEVAASHKELEIMLSDETASRTSAESRLITCDEVIDALRAEVSSGRLKLDSTLIRMDQCDQELAYASSQLSNLAEEVARLTDTKDQKLTVDAEVEVLKGDISRLIKLLEQYPGSKHFLSRWNDSDGMSYMGSGQRQRQGSAERDRDIHGRRSYSTPSDHHDSADYSDFIHDRAGGYSDSAPFMSPGEFAHLQRRYGGDTYPLTASFEEEAEHWVPRKAAHVGLQFLAKKIPHVPPRVINEFLRNINKVWLKREQRRFRSLKAFYDVRIGDLKRQLEQKRGIIAESQIRSLKSQIHEGHVRASKGRARRQYETSRHESFEELDDSDGSPRKRMGCSVCDAVLRKRGGGTISHVAKEKLLEASLESLETLGRQSLSNSESRGRGEYYGIDDDVHPSEPYLRGALWLGRNISMVLEQLAESLDSYRSKILSEVVDECDKGSDRRRSVDYERQLSLSINAIDTAVRLTNDSRRSAAGILKRVADINVGDLISFKYLIQTLPIESTLQPFSEGKNNTPKGTGFGVSGSRDGRVDDRGSGRRSSSRSSSRGNLTSGNKSYISPGKTRILFT